MKRAMFLTALASFLPLFAPAARAAELTAFLSVGTPSERWAGGGGGAFAIGLFHIASFEAEGAIMPGEINDQKMLSLTGSAFLAPSFGKLVPYVGIGVGVARQETALGSDDSTIHTFAIGLKFHLAPLILIKGEYRKIGLPDDALIPFDSRYSLGAGVSF
jgi:hypothetical protein